VLNSEPTRLSILENGYRNLFILGRNNAVKDYYTSFKYGITKDIALKKKNEELTG